MSDEDLMREFGLSAKDIQEITDKVERGDWSDFDAAKKIECRLIPEWE